MAWGVIFALLAWSLIPKVKQTGKLFVPAILMLSILPDADIFLEGFGVAHRTLTHSFFFWLIIFTPVFVVLRLKSIPYFVAVVQHFAFGDLLMGHVMLFWPFSGSTVGLNFSMVSATDLFLELGGLLLATVMLSYFGYLRQLFSVDKKNIFMGLPLLALLISALFFAAHWSSITQFTAYILASRFLIVTAIANIVLFVFLALATFYGFRAYLHKAK